MTQDSETNTDSGKCGKDPAPQPHGKDPQADCTKDPYDKKPPDLPPADECKSCCNCPPAPQPEDSCFDKLIREEAKTAALGEEAKKSKAELEGFLAKMRTASAKYTPEARTDLIKRWKENDKLLCEVIRKLLCNIPCWWCVIECEICPLIYAIANDERRLKGTNALYTTADNLYDQRYWWSRERDIQQEAFDRVNNVMTAWMDPFASIDKALKTVATEAGAANTGKMLGPELYKLLYDVFLKWVPLHLAIAPPATEEVTCIQKKFVELCGCEKVPDPDDCCGPNVGPLTVRERLTGPQAFLIKAEDYPPLFCCLATNTYRPAKAALAAASAAWAAIDAEVEALKKGIPGRLAGLEAVAKIRLGKPISCDDYQRKDGSDQDCCDDEGGQTGQTTPGTVTPNNTRTAR
jgi:hypothetical protein